MFIMLLLRDCGDVGREEKVASAREPDNGLLLAVLVWLNLETRKKRESLAKVRHVRAYESTAGA